MTLAAPFADAITREARGRAPSRVVIATINRAEGDTGVHTHTRMLRDGLRAAAATCDVVSAFGGSAIWLGVFAFRPLLLHRVNKTWSTLWHRRWHQAAVRSNLQRHLSAHSADVIVAQCPVSARAALDARATMGLKCAVVLVCHFNHSEAAEYRAKGELADSRTYQAMLDFESRVLEEVDRVIYVSNWARENVEAVRGLRTRSSAVVWNGIEDAPQSPPLTRAQLGLRDEDLVLVNVGSMEPRKNQLGLIELFSMIHAQYDRARLVLVGDGPQKADVQEQVAERKLNDVVLFLGHRRDVASLLPLADLYVHYASLENCPLVLLEAARAGLAVAAVPTGGVPELQAALDCKFDIIPADTRESLNRLRPLLEDANFRRAAGKRAAEAFRKTFSRDAMTQAYLRALTMD